MRPVRAGDTHRARWLGGLQGRALAIPIVLLCLAASALAPRDARAQSAGPDDTLRYRADRGLHLPWNTVADPRGALAISTNPAGLAGLAGSVWNLNGSFGGSRIGGSSGMGWGLFWGRGFGSVALGTSLEQVVDRDLAGRFPDRLRISRWSLALATEHSRWLRTGVAARLLPVEGDAGAVWSWDIGVQLLPTSWLSVAARLDGLSATGRYRSDQPGTATTPAGGPRMVAHRALGVALRPFAGSEALTVASELTWPTAGELSGTRTTVASQIVDGLTAVIEHRWQKPTSAEGLVGASADQRLSLLLRLGWGALGTDVALHADRVAGGREGQGGMHVGLRIADDEPPALLERGPAGVVLPLAGALTERPSDRPTLTHLIAAFDRLARSESTELVLLRADGFAASWAQVEELREAIGRLRARGKRVVYYASMLGTRGLLLASACDHIIMTPAGAMEARGVGVDFVGLADALTAVGLAVEAVRFEDHKTAPEALTRRRISANQRALFERLVAAAWRRFTEGVAAGRKLDVAKVVAALEAGAVFPEDARRAGLIDAVLHPDDVEPALWKLGWLRHGARLAPFRGRPPRRTRWGPQPAITVVAVEGTIAAESGLGLLGEQAGADRLTQAIDDARRDPDVRGLVLRLSTGGGDATASEAIHDATTRFAEDKPVVASMGTAAASGGYWAALAAPWMIADDATITGSIGIFLLKPNIRGLRERWGIGRDHIGAGPWDDVRSVQKPWTEAERAMTRKTIGRFYGLFLDRVGERRKLKGDALRAVAGGRVWLGDEARQRGLVDARGGLYEALARVRADAGLQGDDDVAIRLLPEAGWRVRLGLGFGAMLRAVVGDSAASGSTSWGG